MRIGLSSTVPSCRGPTSNRCGDDHGAVGMPEQGRGSIAPVDELAQPRSVASGVVRRSERGGCARAREIWCEHTVPERGERLRETGPRPCVGTAEAVDVAIYDSPRSRAVLEHGRLTASGEHRQPSGLLEPRPFRPREPPHHAARRLTAIDAEPAA